MGERVFTEEELKQYDGLEGRPAYFAYKGKVYDASGSSHWYEGDHAGMHQAGQDLTAAMDDAPHDEDVILELPVVGILKD